VAEWKAGEPIADVIRIVGTNGVAQPGLAPSSFGTGLWRGTQLVGSSGGTIAGTVAFTVTEMASGTGMYETKFTPPDAYDCWNSLVFHSTYVPSGFSAAYPVKSNDMDDVYSRLTALISPIGSSVQVPRETMVELIRGDNRTLVFEALDNEGAGILLTGGTGWFTIKERSADTDGRALMQKITITAAQGSITGTSRFEVYLGSSDYAGTGTSAFKPEAFYRYDAQAKGTNGRIYTVSRGPLIVHDDVTKAT
jgi:hypothetical protein